MSKTAFIGFGEVNTPEEVIVKKCADAEKSLLDKGLDLISVYLCSFKYSSIYSVSYTHLTLPTILRV